MAYIPSDKGSGMDFSEPGWWAMAIAALGGFFGWRVKSAQDAVRIEAMQREQEAMKTSIRHLESGWSEVKISMATLAAQNDSISRLLVRLENKLDGKADKP